MAGCRPAAVGVVVSVFVNPTQFGPGEDYSTYPRQLEQDSAAAISAGADMIFAPDVPTIYPPDQPVDIPPLPAVATQPGLEDAFRPSHFAGVCQVVARLFDLVQPRWAVFGEKDWQQLQVVMAMVRQQNDRSRPRWRDLEIVSLPTVREPGGLAMSSRNAYLDSEQRQRALGLNRALDAAQLVRLADAEREMADILQFHELEADYAVIRDATTLLRPTRPDRPLRALIAARIGAVRLIDNMAVDPLT